MQFLSDVYVTCPDCNGRAASAPRSWRWPTAGRTIADVLDLTVDRGAALLRGPARGGPGAAAPGRRRPRLPPARPADQHPVRRRVPAAEARAPPAPRPGRPGTRSSSSTSPRPACTSRTSGRCWPRCSALVDAGHTCSSSSTTWTWSRPPTGSSTSARRAASRAAGSWPPARRRRSPRAASHTGRFLEAYLNGRGRFEAPPTGRPPGSPKRARPMAPGPRRRRSRSAAPASTTCKDIDLALPHDQLVVLTGVSGSGKSTLAFDILFAEGQRRYLESLSPYVRQYMKIMERPDVDAAHRPPADGGDRAAHQLRRAALHGRDADRDLPLPAPALQQARRAALPRLRPAAGRADRRRPSSTRCARASAATPVTAARAQGASAARGSTRRCSSARASTASPTPGSTACSGRSRRACPQPLPRAHDRARRRAGCRRAARSELRPPRPEGGRRPHQRPRRRRPGRRVQPARHLPGLRDRLGAPRPAPVLLQQPPGRLPGLRGPGRAGPPRTRPRTARPPSARPATAAGSSRRRSR